MLYYLINGLINTIGIYIYTHDIKNIFTMYKMKASIYIPILIDSCLLYIYIYETNLIINNLNNSASIKLEIHILQAEHLLKNIFESLAHTSVFYVED